MSEQATTNHNRANKSTLVVIVTEGVISDRIEHELDGKLGAMKNTIENWALIHSLSKHPYMEVTWERRSMGGDVLETLPWLESPTYTFRQRELEKRINSVKGGN